MKKKLLFLFISGLCLIGFSVVAETNIGKGGKEIEVGSASPVTLELKNMTGKDIKDVWVRVINGANTKITKMNIFGHDGTDYDDNVDDDNDGKLQPGENDNDFPAGVTQGRTILGADHINNSVGPGDRRFKLVLHFNPMDQNVKVKIILSEEDNTGYHTNVCLNTPLTAGSGLLTVPAGNDLISTDIINNDFNPVSILTASCLPDLYTFTDVSLKAPFENSIITIQDDMLIVELSPYLAPNDSLTLFTHLTNPVENESEIQVNCNYSEAIPTLSEWGVITLLLLVVAIGMVFLYQRKTALAFAGGSEASSSNQKLFDRKLFAKVFAVVLLIGAAGLLGAYMYFGSITNADPFGVVVSSGIIAYMVQLWLLKKS